MWQVCVEDHTGSHDEEDLDFSKFTECQPERQWHRDSYWVLNKMQIKLSEGLRGIGASPGNATIVLAMLIHVGLVYLF